MYDPKSILQMARGAFQERVDLEMVEVIDRMLVVKGKSVEQRELRITKEFTPDDDRQNIGVSVSVKSALAPTTPARTTLWVAGDNSTGECQVVEMVPQVPGQMSMDGEEQEAPASLKIIKMA